MPAASYKTAGELVQQAEDHILEEANNRVDHNISDPREGEHQPNARRIWRQNIVDKIQDLLQVDNGDIFHGADSVLRTGNLQNAHKDSHNITRASSAIHQVTEVGGKKANAADTPSPRTHSIGGVWGVLHGCSAFQQIGSPWFTLVALFTILEMLRINYFVATIRQQYEHLLSSPQQAKRINDIFDILLPVGGLLSVPFIGNILDIVSTPSVLIILVTVATLIGILGCIPAIHAAGFANITLFVLYRPFYYTAVSDYAAEVFGFHTFGKVYGLIICLAGLGNFTQPFLDFLTFRTFHTNPIPVNLALTAITVLCGGALVGFVTLKARLIRAKTGACEAHAAIAHPHIHPASEPARMAENGAAHSLLHPRWFGAVESPAGKVATREHGAGEREPLLPKPRHAISPATKLEMDLPRRVGDIIS